MPFIAPIIKELLLLLRDRVGLIILFLLPLCLVIFITVTQPDALNHTQKLSVLIVNQAKTPYSKAIVKAIKKLDGLKVTNKRYKLSATRRDVAQGKYQAALFIPYNFNKKNTITIYLDPTVPDAIKGQLELTSKYLTQTIQVKAASQRMGRTLIKPTTIKSQYITIGGNFARPNVVQENVPAWSLFGMFFVVIPLAGMMVRERELGVLQRLKIAPISNFSLSLGRVIAFIILNQLQLWVMLSAGLFILPLFGLPTLDLSGHVWQVLIIGVFASLAAIGFGSLVGSLTRTYEQAAFIGPFIIVILAAIGGILVPTYMMPTVMQPISEFSPLHWAHQSFIEILVRHATLEDIRYYLLALFSFFIGTFLLSLWIQNRRSI